VYQLIKDWQEGRGENSGLSNHGGAENAERGRRIVVPRTLIPVSLFIATVFYKYVR